MTKFDKSKRYLDRDGATWFYSHSSDAWFFTQPDGYNGMMAWPAPVNGPHTVINDEPPADDCVPRHMYNTLLAELHTAQTMRYAADREAARLRGRLSEISQTAAKR